MNSTARASTITIVDAAVVSAVCFGLSIVVSVQALLAGFPAARFSEAGNTWMICEEIAWSAIALIYLFIRGFDISSLYPSPSVRGSLAGLGLFVGAWLAGALVIGPFVNIEKPQMIEFSYAGISMLSTVVFAMVNGAFEEVFLLGVLRGPCLRADVFSLLCPASATVATGPGAYPLGHRSGRGVCCLSQPWPHSGPRLERATCVFDESPKIKSAARSGHAPASPRCAPW